jgi:class 3 adenylate cyclase/tetratricopeptide (TPR) repeat protein
MRCASCETDNEPDNRFCVACGTALNRACPSCGHANAPDARFCAQCGVVQARAGSGQAAPPTTDGELKQITVLFADVSGSTSLIEGLDPEEAGHRLAPAIEAMKDAVRRFEGSVVRVAGDGIMALFGAPNPQEDHAVRGCCAALAMQAAAKALPEGSMPIRVGLHSGEVLARTVATDFSTDFDVAGITVHIASRLESLAPDGGIVLSGATLRGARKFVSVDPMGLHPIRGLSAPLEVFLLTGLRRGPTSERFANERGLSDFLGRDAELALLERGLERAAEGEGCVVGVVADAGIGKSRLCFEFAEGCRKQGVRVLEGHALAHSRATPYVPMIDVVKSYFEIPADETAERARERVARHLAGLGPGFETDLPLLLDFLGLAAADAERPKVDPTARRERLEALFRRLVRMAGSAQPAVILLEDLHLMDSGSESLIEVLVGALQGTKLLLIVNYRPGHAAPWMHGGHYDQISLSPLRTQAADLLTARLLGGDESVMPLLPLIADRARGNPLFIEELVRKFEESGHLAGERGAYRLLRPPDMRLIPDTVQAIIGARIDSRPEVEKSVLQTAAVIGREFAVPILARVVGGLASALSHVLHRLSSAGLVYESSTSEGMFAFRHPMVQDVVYRSILSERRRGLHASIAAELDKTLPDPNGAQAGFIAYHWEESGNAMQAASYNMKAATWHGTRDPAQALDAWKRVRRLLIDLPLEGAAQYPLLMANGQIVNLAWREGVTAADAQPYYAEALEIARALGDMRAVTLVTAAYGRVLAASGSAVDYVATVSDVLGQVDDKRDASLKVVLTAILCHALRLAGDLPHALAANDTALARLHEVAEADQQTLGFNVGVWVKGMRGQILAMMGRAEEARLLLDALIAADEATVDLLHRLLAHATHVDIAWSLGDVALASQHSEQVMQLAERSGNPYLLVYGRGYAGLAQAMRGDYAGATTTLSDALAYARQRNAGLENEARLLADLAHVQLRAGLPERARATAEEAAVVARRRGAKVWLAYAEWLNGGPEAPAFTALIDATGADLLKRLPHPRG